LPCFLSLCLPLRKEGRMFGAGFKVIILETGSPGYYSFSHGEDDLARFASAGVAQTARPGSFA
jgi:hypothetical protein